MVTKVNQVKTKALTVIASVRFTVTAKHFIWAATHGLREATWT